MQRQMSEGSVVRIREVIDQGVERVATDDGVIDACGAEELAVGHVGEERVGQGEEVGF